MTEDREAILHSAENLVAAVIALLQPRIGHAAAVSVVRQVASAGALLFPLCGEHTTIGVLEQMADEQSRLAARNRFLRAQPPSTAQH